MFSLLLIFAATPAPAPAPVDCTTLQKVVDHAPTASAPRLLLSVCLERRGSKDDAIAMARGAIPLAIAEDGWPQHGLNHLQPTLKRLAALGVDLPIPAPGTCGTLERPATCARSAYVACTRPVAKQAERYDWGRLDLTVSPYFKEAQTTEDPGDSPTFGLPVRMRIPGTCSLANSLPPDFAAPTGQVATLVLESKIQRHAADAGSAPILDATCRLVAADPCLELVASVCTLKLSDREPQTVVIDHRVQPERSEPEK